jgi:hypothetical protein
MAHYVMGVSSSMGDALAWIDPHGERTWEESSDADDTRVLISRRYKEGSVAEGLTGMPATQI